MTVTLEDEIRQAQQEVHRAAQKAAQAEQRLTAAQAEAEAAQEARVRAWAQRMIQTYPVDVAAGLQAIRDAQQAFYAAAVDDLSSAMAHYITWMEARHRLRLRYYDQQNALTRLEEPKTGLAAQSLTSPLPSFEPDFNRALNEAVALRAREAVHAVDDAHQAAWEKLLAGE